MSLAKLAQGVLDVVYPRQCGVCRSEGSFLCSRCRDRLPPADGLRCSRCWLPLTEGFACSRCAERPLALSALRSVFRHEDEVRTLVRALKFHGISSLAEPLGDCMADLLGDAAELDALVAVPMSGRRQRIRGYNQSQLLARQIASCTNLPVIDVLTRQGKQTPQTETSTAAQRRDNMRDAFRSQKTDLITGKRLVVVDDVATTVATLDACARILLAAGAKEVFGLTFARED
jgi:ComF family protein